MKAIGSLLVCSALVFSSLSTRAADTNVKLTTLEDRVRVEIGGQLFYIHHDGYPSGAANYFANMIEALNVPDRKGRGIGAIEERAGGIGFAFIRGNLKAEPTTGHSDHGDTEYRWKVEEIDKRLVVKANVRRSSDVRPLWSGWSAGEPLAAMIGHHYPGAIVAIESPDHYWKRELLATLENAIGIAQAHRSAEARYAEGNPNKANATAHAEAWEAALAEQLPKRIQWLEKEAAEAGKPENLNGFIGHYYRELEAELVAELLRLEAYRDQRAALAA